MKTSFYNQTFVLGVTGGIAIYKSCELIRLLKKNGAIVHVVMTKSATELIKPSVFQALSGKHVYTSMWNDITEFSMPHIHLSRDASAIIVAPSTANFMAKIANGIADDLLSTLCLARNVPLLVAPSMNVEMWNNPATQRNYQNLLKDGVVILEPCSGSQACGDNGPGRMLEPETVISYLRENFSDTFKAKIKHKVLNNKTVLVTAGPTYEAIDPIRGITNRSSGKLGYAIAETAKKAGAKVFLVSGPVSIGDVPSVHIENVESAAQMLRKVRKILKEEIVDIFFSVAAVADWTPKKFVKTKIKKNSSTDLKDINWIETKDILLEVASNTKESRPFVVGFAAETKSGKFLLNACQKKLEAKKADMIIGTNGPDTFGQDKAHMLICSPGQPSTNIEGTKTQIASQLIQLIQKQINQKNEN